MDGLDSAISTAGSAASLARIMGTTPAVISNWRSRGVPVERVLEVARATGWVVTPHDLRPDIYPHPLDGLPTERRGCECAAQGAI